ncbi:hypothetical protein [Amycolatopsis marina]|nr:hypothetical protein [Amycolatopsis marina]
MGTLRSHLAVVLAAATVGVLSACDGGQAESTSRLSATDLSGFVRLNVPSSWAAGPMNAYLTFHDPDDGVERLRLDLTVTREDRRRMPTLGDYAFSRDFRRVAWIGADGGVRVGEVDDGTRAYAETGSVAAPREGRMEYALPQFSPDGSQVWFMSRTDDKKSWDKEDARWEILSVTAADPSGAPPQLRGEVAAPAEPRNDLRRTFVQMRGFLPDMKSAVVVSADNTLRILDSAFDGDDPRGLEYFTDGSELIPANFVHYTGETYFRLSWSENGSAGIGPYVIAFDMAPDGTVSNERVLFHRSDRTIRRLFVDADNDRLILSGDGYYAATTNSEVDPRPLFDKLTYTGREEKYTERSTLGLYPPEPG